MSDEICFNNPIGIPKDKCSHCYVENLEQQLAKRDELIKIALEALDHYTHRMGMGGTARVAIKKIKSEVESE
jgi:hypothetical protein